MKTTPPTPAFPTLTGPLWHRSLLAARVRRRERRAARAQHVAAAVAALPAAPSLTAFPKP